MDINGVNNINTLQSVTQKREKIGVLGVGNLLLSDEGVGVHLIRYLEQHYIMPAEVELYDGGTAGLYLSTFVETCRVLIVVVALAIVAQPGTIRIYYDDEVKAGLLQTNLSPHQVGFLETIELCRLQDREPEQLVVIGICPANIDAGVELSTEIREMLPLLAAEVMKQLSRFGITVAPREEVSDA